MRRMRFGYRPGQRIAYRHELRHGEFRDAVYNVADPPRVKELQRIWHIMLIFKKQHVSRIVVIIDSLYVALLKIDRRDITGQRITASDLRYPRNAPYGCPRSIDELSVAQTATVCVDLRHGIVVARYLYLGVIVGGLRSHIEPFAIRERETGQRITMSSAICR